MMEVYAGFLEHTDAQVGRVVDFIESLGELDNTIVLVMSDNGASAEGGPRGSFNENYFFNMVPESLEENLRRIDDLGGPDAHNHYPWGWAWAGNTPLKRWKRETHEGGVTDPLIVSLAGRARRGRRGPPPVRPRHRRDADAARPHRHRAAGEIAGVAQRPLDGASFRATFDDAAAPSPRSTQYYEMLGCRAIYHDGWKAVTFHPMVGLRLRRAATRRCRSTTTRGSCTTSPRTSPRPSTSPPTSPSGCASSIELWWSEAERNQVLPLNNQPGPPRRPPLPARAATSTTPGIGVLPAAVAPNLRNRGFRITADARRARTAAPTGVIVTPRRRGRRLRAVPPGRPAALDVQLARRRGHDDLQRRATLPAGPCTVERDVHADRPLPGRRRAAATTTSPIGKGHVPATTPITYGIVGFTVGYQRGTPVSPTYEAPFAARRRRAAPRRRRTRRPRVPRPARRGARRRRDAVAIEPTVRRTGRDLCRISTQIAPRDGSRPVPRAPRWWDDGRTRSGCHGWTRCELRTPARRSMCRSRLLVAVVERRAGCTRSRDACPVRRRRAAARSGRWRAAPRSSSAGADRRRGRAARPRSGEALARHRVGAAATGAGPGACGGGRAPRRPAAGRTGSSSARCDRRSAASVARSLTVCCSIGCCRPTPNEHAGLGPGGSRGADLADDGVVRPRRRWPWCDAAAGGRGGSVPDVDRGPLRGDGRPARHRRRRRRGSP